MTYCNPPVLSRCIHFRKESQFSTDDDVVDSFARLVLNLGFAPGAISDKDKPTGWLLWSNGKIWYGKIIEINPKIKFNPNWSSANSGNVLCFSLHSWCWPMTSGMEPGCERLPRFDIGKGTATFPTAGSKPLWYLWLVPESRLHLFRSESKQIHSTDGFAQAISWGLSTHIKTNWSIDRLVDPIWRDEILDVSAIFSKRPGWPVPPKNPVPQVFFPRVNLRWINFNYSLGYPK